MGFTKKVIKIGNGVKPLRGQKVTVNCTGFGKDRDLTKQFWSTKDAGQEPFTFAVGLGQGMHM
jgi:peptidylprolyl isomerase